MAFGLQKKVFLSGRQPEQCRCYLRSRNRAHMEHLEGQHLLSSRLPSYFVDAEKKGYSGVGLYCKKNLITYYSGLGWSCADCEGRYIQLDFGDSVLPHYTMPSGTSGDEMAVD